MKKQLSKVMAVALVVSSVPAVVWADTTSEKLVGENRIETAIKVSKNNWKMADTVVLVNEKAIADALAITPLAEEKNAPILLTGKDGLNKLTKDEIKRLGAKNVILAGGNSVLSKKLEKELKELNLNIDRISGKNREETSLEILKRLDNINDISEVVVVNGTTGLADAVSIAAVAAKNNMGIILANPKNGIKVFEEFIKNEDIKKSYIIGGDKALPNKLVESLPSKERISGANRTETNLRILEKFYSSKKLNAIYVAKDGMGKENQLVDALAIGVVAAKNNAPILIVSNKLKDSQKDYVNSKKINKVVQVGGNGNEKIFEEILNLQKSKTYEVNSLKELEEALKKVDANDKIVINFDTEEEIVITTKSSVEIENNGNIGNIKLEGSNADITNKGTIGNLDIEDSNNTEIKNVSTGKIENIKNNGNGTKIDNDGSIDKVTGDIDPSIDGNRPGGITGGSSSGGSTGGSTGGETQEKSTPNFNKESLMKAMLDLSVGKTNIKIKFLDKIPSDINEKNHRDVSIEENTGKVFAYSEDTISEKEGSYTTIYVVADGKVVAPESLKYLFGFDGINRIREKITSIDLTNLDTSNVKDMSSMFAVCSNLSELNLANIDTSNVENMMLMFAGCTVLSELDVSNLNTSKVKNMSYMFGESIALSKLDVSKFDTSNVTRMNSMFIKCGELSELDVSKFDTSKVTRMDSMFRGCSKLTNLDVSKFNTGSATDMSSMFQGCSKLTNLDVSNFDTGSVEAMAGMFYKCSGLTSLDVSNFNTSKVTHMGGMFWECSGLTSLDVSNFNTSNAARMDKMFKGCSNLSGNITIMNPAITECQEMFNGTSTASDTNFTVNYTDGCGEMVDKILNDSTTKGNVVKGTEVIFPPITIE